MSGSRTLFVVDGELHRRNAICRLLTERNVYVEPFESLEELSAHRPCEGVVMIADEPGAVNALIAHMAAQVRWLAVIAFAEDPKPLRIARAIREGATTYVAWPCSVEQLIAAISDAVCNVEMLVGLQMRTKRARSRLERLTRRERQVLEAMTDGLSNREIGKRLSISARTVEIHRSNMMSKVGAHHTTEAIRIAIEASLAESIAAPASAQKDASKTDEDSCSTADKVPVTMQLMHHRAPTSLSRF